jgi:hypothetical protein
LEILKKHFERRIVMEYTWMLIAWIFGALVGAFITLIIVRKHTSHGTLVVDLTDPEKDVFRLILDEDLESIAEQKHVRLKVAVRSEHSQQ